MIDRHGPQRSNRSGRAGRWKPTEGFLWRAGAVALAVAGVAAATLVMGALSERDTTAEAVQAQKRAFKIEVSTREFTQSMAREAAAGRPFERVIVRVDAGLELKVGEMRRLTLPAHVDGAVDCSLSVDAIGDLELITVAMRARALTCGGDTRQVSGPVRSQDGGPIQAELVWAERTWGSLMLEPEVRVKLPAHLVAAAWLDGP